MCEGLCNERERERESERKSKGDWDQCAALFITAAVRQP